MNVEWWLSLATQTYSPEEWFWRLPITHMLCSIWMMQTTSSLMQESLIKIYQMRRLISIVVFVGAEKLFAETWNLIYVVNMRKPLMVNTQMELKFFPLIYIDLCSSGHLPSSTSIAKYWVVWLCMIRVLIYRLYIICMGNHTQFRIYHQIYNSVCPYVVYIRLCIIRAMYDMHHKS